MDREQRADRKKHYLQVTDADFQRASKSGADSGAVDAEKPAQKAAQQAAAPAGTRPQESKKPQKNQGFLQSSAAPYGLMPPNLVPLVGVERSQEPQEKSTAAQEATHKATQKRLLALFEQASKSARRACLAVLRADVLRRRARTRFAQHANRRHGSGQAGG